MLMFDNSGVKLQYSSMLITCPKCGFQQPKDNYCANCGVNIEKYTPTKESFISKLSSSLFFQSLLVLFIAVLGSYYYFQIQNEKKIKHIKQNTAFMSQSLKNQTPTSELKTNKNQTSETSLTTNTEIKKVDIPPLSESQKNALTQSGQGLSTTPSSTVAMPSQQASAPTLKTTTLIFKFVEIPTIHLKRWIDLNRNTLNGLIPKSDLSLIEKSRILDNQTITIRNSSSETLSFPKETTTETRSDMGLGLDILLTKKDEKNFDLSFIKRFHIKEEKQSFSVDINPSGPTYFYWDGLIKGFESYPEILSQNPFIILNSDYYRSNKTELVLIIELDK